MRPPLHVLDSYYTLTHISKECLSWMMTFWTESSERRSKAAPPLPEESCAVAGGNHGTVPSLAGAVKSRIASPP